MSEAEATMCAAIAAHRLNMLVHRGIARRARDRGDRLAADRAACRVAASALQIRRIAAILGDAD